MLMKMAAKIDHCCSSRHIRQTLNGFKGSPEEKIVQNIFRAITAYTDFVRFVNLEIHKCNAEEGTVFSDAFISLRTTIESMRLWKTRFVSGRPDCQVVDMKNMLDTTILDTFRENGVDAIEKCSKSGVDQSFIVLLNFLQEIESHEKAIWKLLNLNTVTNETQVVTGLAHHLFSQLVPGKTYEVDDCAKQLPKTCGCGCNDKICGGNTSLGSVGTWHGRVDIMVNDTVAVVIGKEQTSVQDDEEDSKTEGEPQKKQRKVETYESRDICVEDKRSRRYECILLDQKILKQILAKAITNGFAQVHRDHSALSNFLIPSFGATSDRVSVCLYDPENDCLLHIKKELKLWIKNGIQFNLDIETIIIIWFFLNFTVFTKRNLGPEIGLKKSRLHEDLKDDLKYYRETKSKGNFVSMTADESPWERINITLAHPQKSGQKE